jgi:uncharacterized protein (TIGR02001 family)
MTMKTTLAAMTLAAATLVSGAAVAQEKRELGYSFNVALTSDYIFRGFSQTERGPTGQAGFDLTWGKAYFGVWGSGIDFGLNAANDKVASFELDVYAGVKPEWMGFTFDFGAIAYLYPGARDNGASAILPGEANYFELKAGVSREVVKNLTLAQTFYYSPDYTNSTGRVWTSETAATLVLPEIAGITPTLSALYGYQQGKSRPGSATDFVTLIGNGKDNYSYWNAGVTFAWQKFTFDVRYWDTNIANTGNFCTGTTFQCDQTVMGTLKFTY